MYETIMEWLPGFALGLVPSLGFIIPFIKNLKESVLQKQTVGDLFKIVREFENKLKDSDMLNKSIEDNFKEVVDEFKVNLKDQMKDINHKTEQQFEKYQRQVGDSLNEVNSQMNYIGKSTSELIESLLTRVAELEREKEITEKGVNLHE